jgi:23S rRNA (cytosine1962-C5)-methyltransferase
MTLTKVIIKAGKDKSIMRRHPWVFSGAIKNIEGVVNDGDLVEVIANKGRHLAYGHFQNGSIAVRLLLFEGEALIENLYRERIEKAMALRSSLGLIDNPDCTIYRLVQAEGDFLPGLIVDHYDGHLVIQTHSIGMFKDIEIICEALKDIYADKLKSIYLKSGSVLPKEYMGYTGDTYLFGSAETPVTATEYGNKFAIDWINGQKTGFFIDQRENRALIAKYSRGKKVLNTFCYSGGFSVYALQAGAELVHSLDASKKAIELTEENIQLGGFEATRHVAFVAEAMEFMKDLKDDYDIMVLDPPAFAKHRNAKHKAVQGYKRLNAHAIRQIKSGGIIFTFSCSQVVDKVLFYHTIVAAAISANRKVRVLEQLHQPADHPISTNHPEGEYLKGLVIQVD